MSETPETTATFNRLVNNGLVARSDLVREGFHEAATEVMVERGGDADNDNPTAVSRRAKAPRAREEDDITDDRRRREAEESEAVRPTEVMANGFGKLADELAKLIISPLSDRQVGAEDAAEQGSPTFTEANVLGALCCGPVLQGLLHPTKDAGHDGRTSPGQMRAAAMDEPQVLEREMPEAMM
eukprot:GILI01022394.1.p1 GENE.GILI01022394.1~~GILI01022394.1.p1  ORF type:complete len:195 (-),score=46.68 GILI01022394.1:79-627(-)